MKAVNKNLEDSLNELEDTDMQDLSRMEAHWEQMKVNLANTGSGTKGPIYRNPYFFVPALVIIALLLVFYKSNRQSKPGIAVLATTPAIETIPSDTTPIRKEPVKAAVPDSIFISAKDTIYLEAINSQGKKTSLPAFSVKEYPSAPRGQWEDSLRKMRQPAGRFLIDRNRDTILRGKQGSVIKIRANSFDGTGKLIIELEECLHYDDMIANKLLTVSGERQLISGGMINLVALDENRSIQPNSNARIEWLVPNIDAKDSMQLFIGKPISLSDTIGGPMRIDWQATGRQFNRPAYNRTGVITRKLRPVENRVLRPTIDTINNKIDFVSVDSIISESSDLSVDFVLNDPISVNLPSFGWINCDKFYNDGRNKRDITVQLGDTATNYYTVLVFQRIKSIIPGICQDKEIVFKNLPEGETVTIVSMGYKNGQFLTALQPVTISANAMPSLQFRPSSTTELAAELRSVSK